MNPLKSIMEFLAIFDFERGLSTRLQNKHYLKQYGDCYQQNAIDDHYTGI